ncbi:SGNH/GDSL hydrolase family protein [Streptomyces sp. Amel2xC10]|uniref:SGNH/GDSL hydrolase family protein n=1 Tax=Streptomyces sp. Amel2xC10 TaxID=1305826 RepID=UPI000A08EAB3|nr:SGNH/GDSL hydrolase family protein [Streptomyces sp. Amel2xC10]SMF78861.1 GDSL-like Lipase/Acylhydrolase family protein [Streptomyces sp. Amel2xC10]
MKIPRLISALSASLVVAALSLTNAGSAHAAGNAYVALGDSYSSGVGANSYIASSGGCQRSTNAYPYLWNASHSYSSFAFNACSGARTDDVLANQLGSLDADTAFVTLTIGGNDAGFSDVMRTCILSIRSVCHDRVMQVYPYISSTLPAKFDNLYSAIRTKAPNAKVVVLNYPQPYELNNGFCAGLTNDSRYDLNSATEALNSLISQKARQYGFSVANADSTFSNHRICNDDSWLYDLNLSDIGVSYHPKPAGQRAYLQALNMAS